jgi:hypothetical protein
MWVSAQRDNPGKLVPVSVMGRLAGDRWAAMSAREREPYEQLSAASKAEYAHMKTLTPAQRAMVVVGAQLRVCTR